MQTWPIDKHTQTSEQPQEALTDLPFVPLICTPGQCHCHPEETTPFYIIHNSTNKVTEIYYYARWYEAIAQCPWQVHRVSRNAQCLRQSW